MNILRRLCSETSAENSRSRAPSFKFATIATIATILIIMVKFGIDITIGVGVLMDVKMEELQKKMQTMQQIM